MTSTQMSESLSSTRLAQVFVNHGIDEDGGVLVPGEHHIGGFHDWLRTRIHA